MAVMHRILTEQPDISGVPESLIPVIADCLNKDPSKRPSARDLLLRLVDPSVANRRPIAGTGPPGPDDLAARTGPVPWMAGATASDFGPGQLATGPTPAPRRSRRGPVLAAGGAAAAALIAVVVLLLTRGSPGYAPTSGVGSTSSGTAGTSPASQASTPASTAIQAAGGVIPAAFAGTWSGTATMAATALPSFGLTNSISFTLVKGGTTAAEVNDSCTNTLTLTKATATVLTFSEPGTDQCVAGTVTFTLRDGNLAYRWAGGGEQNTATLSKK